MTGGYKKPLAKGWGLGETTHNHHSEWRIILPHPERWLPTLFIALFPLVLWNFSHKEKKKKKPFGGLDRKHVTETQNWLIISLCYSLKVDDGCFSLHSDEHRKFWVFFKTSDWLMMILKKQDTAVHAQHSRNGCLCSTGHQMCYGRESTYYHHVHHVGAFCELPGKSKEYVRKKPWYYTKNWFRIPFQEKPLAAFM